jgi:hypothetical protein
MQLPIVVKGKQQEAVKGEFSWVVLAVKGCRVEIY